MAGYPKPKAHKYNLGLELFDIKWEFITDLYGNEVAMMKFNELPKRITLRLEMDHLGDMAYKDDTEEKDKCVAHIAFDALEAMYHFRVRSYRYRTFFRRKNNV